MTKHSVLYTEMITSGALIHGDRDRFLQYNAEEHPVALQVGGHNPKALAECAQMAEQWGYDEINLNCGCPSDRVQSGTFGAVLMKHPKLVADCVAAMQEAVEAEVTVKCRIGVDDQNPHDVLPDFLEHLNKAGVTRVTIHARKAWLQGLSPKENRDIPPLDYDLVFAMKRAFPQMHISINGGIADLDTAQSLLERGLDGVMIGRSAYHQPWDILGDADIRLFGGDTQTSARAVAHEMLPYIDAHLQSGGRLHQVTRHMLGLFAGKPGARRWRQVLSTEATKTGAGPEVVLAALKAMDEAQLV